jgi:hypothetical protein
MCSSLRRLRAFLEEVDLGFPLEDEGEAVANAEEDGEDLMLEEGVGPPEMGVVGLFAEGESEPSRFESSTAALTALKRFSSATIFFIPASRNYSLADTQTRGTDHLHSQGTVRSLNSSDDGKTDFKVLHGGNDSRRNHIALNDPAKDVHQYDIDLLLA